VLSSFEKISSWILSWGEHAEVLEPMELRQTIGARLAAVSAIYEQKPKARTPLPRSGKLNQKPR
jgi:hypothetical protein